MNLEQVAYYIAHPHELQISEAEPLRVLSEKYPYAAVFSLLYLTALSNGKSVDLDAALQQHAYRLSDRTRLYHLLHERPEMTPEAEASPVEEISLPLQDPVEAISELPEITPEMPEIPVEEPLQFTEERSIDAAQEVLDQDGDFSSDFGRITEAFTLEQHYAPESAENASQEAPPESFEKQEIAVEPTAGIPEKNTDPATEPSAVKQEGPAPEIQPEGKRSFTSWLKSGVMTEMRPEQPVTGQLPQEEKTDEKRTVGDIIDNFIREEPTITRNKTEFFSPSKKAKESLDDEALPVSETLAKIFAAQGNYPKAIHVYHQLMLAFPEKKSFFAIQIEALKKKITA